MRRDYLAMDPEEPKQSDHTPPTDEELDEWEVRLKSDVRLTKPQTRRLFAEVRRLRKVLDEIGADVS